jgi:hypothetical protein
MDPNVSTFLEGAFGSALIEVLTIYEFYAKENPFPPRYRKFGFWLIRLLITVGAGLLAFAYGVKDNPLLAVNIGASAPLLMRALGRGLLKH